MDTYPVVRRILDWLPALAWAGVIFVLSAQPSYSLPSFGVWGDLMAAAGHLFVYAVLMLLLLRALGRSTRLNAAQTWIIAFVLVALYGLSDEYHQSFVPGRDPALVDWLTDLTGAGLAWFISTRRQRG